MTLKEFAQRSVSWLGFLAAACLAAGAATPKVTTVAGGYFGDGKLAPSASLARPSGVAYDSKGNLYVSDSYNCRIRVVNTAGVISTYAGTGICGYSGDGGPAKSAEITASYGIAFDRHGDLLITDGSRIRRITPAGIISTVAGNSTFGYSGDGGPATQASLNGPLGVFADTHDNIYIADTGNEVIRKVDSKGIIRTIAGNHIAGFSGDGGPATTASLNFPWSVVADALGNFYIADVNNQRIRVVNTGGTINTFAGNGSFGNTGSGGPATSAAIGQPVGLRLGKAQLYISAIDIWAVDLQTGMITIVAGNGSSGFNGDGNTALATSFSEPVEMASDGSGGMFVADSGNNRVRHIDAKQIVSTTAGGYVGDGGLGTAASLNLESIYAHIAFDPSGNLYIADENNCRIRKVTPGGTISTFAGTGICGYTGDGGPASSATLSMPQAVAADGNGNVYIADTGNLVIRKVDSTGTISTFVSLFLSNNSAESARATGLAVDTSGNLYAADGFVAVWKITPSGTMSVAAGVVFSLGYNGDGILATQAWLNFPTGLAIDRFGQLYIADWLNYRIRKVDTSGIISTVAGNGIPGFGGDGGPATSAMLSLPADVAVDAKDNFYIADWGNLRVRSVNAAGTIQTYAGTGGFGYNGNNLTANQTTVFPQGLAIGPSGVVYVSDGGSYRVRKIH